MTIVFFLSAAALVCVAIAFVVPVILRESTDGSRIARRQKNIDVARQRLDELGSGESDGDSTSVEAAESIRKEIERGLLDDVEGIEEHAGDDDEGRRVRVRQWTAVSASILIPVSAGLLYLVIGEPAVIRDPAMISTPEPTQTVDSGQPELNIDGETISFEQMTQRVLTHLADNPDDIEGWTTLAQLFIAQQQFAEAASAYRKIRELSGDSADLLVREADALAMANDGVLTGEPETLIMDALRLDPNHGSGLWLAGIAAAARGEYQASLKYWRRAESVISNEEFLLEIRRLITGAEAEIAAAEPSASTSDAEAPGYSVRVSVTADASVLQESDAEDTLFVFARASEGPPMPLAVVRSQVGELPLQVDLDDSLAMMENLKLSSFDEVVIVARISKSGAAVATSGDFFGEIGPIRPKDRSEVSVNISERVP
ncbi:MAG: c-type cytochrome biogenesis protein CcmI [Acidiferrobacterales bacterium]|nr:c-type cytochrome biogenesis protein CcmI [Acidiferrobacterales bacterium]